MLFLPAALLLVFAPLVLGGNRPLPLLALELTGVAALAALAWQGLLRPIAGPLPTTLKLGFALLAVAWLLAAVGLRKQA